MHEAGLNVPKAILLYSDMDEDDINIKFESVLGNPPWGIKYTQEEINKALVDSCGIGYIKIVTS